MPNTNPAPVESKRLLLGPHGHARCTLIGEGADQLVRCECGVVFSWTALRAHFRAGSHVAAVEARAAARADRATAVVVLDLIDRGVMPWTGEGLADDDGNEWPGEDEEAYDEGREAASLLAQGATYAEAA